MIIEAKKSASEENMEEDALAGVKQIVAREYLKGKDVFVFDGFAGADEEHQLQVRVVAERAWHALFATTLFIDNKADKLKKDPGFTVINVCNMPMPDYKEYGLNSEVFVIISTSIFFLL